MTAIEQGEPRHRTSSFAKRTLFAALALLILATFYVHEGYVLRPADPQWAHLAPFRWWLIPHVAGGMIALLVGPLQFSATLRRRSPAAHRRLGRLYAAAAILGAALSIYIVLVFEAPVNHWVMGVMGGLWLPATILAWLFALRRDFPQPKLWMCRSYGLSFTFVTTRFIPDVIFPGLDYYD